MFKEDHKTKPSKPKSVHEWNQSKPKLETNFPKVNPEKTKVHHES